MCCNNNNSVNEAHIRLSILDVAFTQVNSRGQASMTAMDTANEALRIAKKLSKFILPEEADKKNDDPKES